jgi:ABC-type multidrug transport system permease subunit
VQSLSVQDFFQFAVVATLAGLFWLQKGQDATLASAQNILGLLFFQLIFLSFRSLFVSLFTFPDEQRMMIKERGSGMYRLSAFYFARTLSDLPMDFALPALFLVVVYFMGGLRYSVAAFFGNFGTVILAMFVAQSLGLLLGSIFMNPKTAQTVASVIMLTIILTGEENHKCFSKHCFFLAILQFSNSCKFKKVHLIST